MLVAEQKELNVCLMLSLWLVVC